MVADLVTAVAEAVVVFPLVVFAHWLILGYRVRNHAIEFLLFHALPVYRLPLGRIRTVRKVGWCEVGIAPATLRLGNRIFVRHFVLIEKKGGFPRRVVVTPSNPDKFINEVTSAKE